MTGERSASQGVVRALLVATGLCGAFFVLRIWHAGAFAYGYLPWNLFLAWIPLGITAVLVRYLRHHRWSSWTSLFLTLAWLVFLPNSFYLVSDYVHLQDISPTDALFDVVMFSAFVFTGLLLGYISLFRVHLELSRRLPPVQATTLIAVVLLACSFAMYLGRDLRRNSWDVLASPTGLLFDVSNQFTTLSQAKVMVSTVLLFFAFLAGAYYVGLRVVRAARLVEPAN
jgi:uncharacterized membrane protein